MKPVKAWAIVNKYNGQIPRWRRECDQAIWDRQGQAIRACIHVSEQVIRVEIHELAVGKYVAKEKR